MKKLFSLNLLAVALLIFGGANLAVGQESHEVRLHLVKEVNGESMSLDTVIKLQEGQSMSDIELPAPWNDVEVHGEHHEAGNHMYKTIRVESTAGDGEVQEVKVWKTDGGEDIHLLEGNHTFFIEVEEDENGEKTEKKHVVIIGDGNVEVRDADDMLFEEKGNMLFEMKDGSDNIFVVRVHHEKMNEDELEDLRKAIDGSYEVAEDGLGVSDLMVFPNPSEGEFKVAFEVKEEASMNLYVFDQSGKRIFSEKLKNIEGSQTIDVDLSNQPAGIYYVNLTDGKTSSTRKVVID